MRTCIRIIFLLALSISSLYVVSCGGGSDENWYDLDPVSNLRTFDALYANDNRHRLLMGPWIHFAVEGESAVSALPPLDQKELKYVDVEKRIQSEMLLHAMPLMVRRAR